MPDALEAGHQIADSLVPGKPHTGIQGIECDDGFGFGEIKQHDILGPMWRDEQEQIVNKVLMGINHEESRLCGPIAYGLHSGLGEQLNKRRFAVAGASHQEFMAVEGLE